MKVFIVFLGFVFSVNMYANTGVWVCQNGYAEGTSFVIDTKNEFFCWTNGSPIHRKNPCEDAERRLKITEAYDVLDFSGRYYDVVSMDDQEHLPRQAVRILISESFKEDHMEFFHASFQGELFETRGIPVFDLPEFPSSSQMIRTPYCARLVLE